MESFPLHRTDFAGDKKDKLIITSDGLSKYCYNDYTSINFFETIWRLIYCIPQLNGDYAPQIGLIKTFFPNHINGNLVYIAAHINASDTPCTQHQILMDITEHYPTLYPIYLMANKLIEDGIYITSPELINYIQFSNHFIFPTLNNIQTYHPTNFNN